MPRVCCPHIVFQPNRHPRNWRLRLLPIFTDASLPLCILPHQAYFEDYGSFSRCIKTYLPYIPTLPRISAIISNCDVVNGRSDVWSVVTRCTRRSIILSPVYTHHLCCIPGNSSQFEDSKVLCRHLRRECREHNESRCLNAYIPEFLWDVTLRLLKVRQGGTLDETFGDGGVRYKRKGASD